jgi:hypothetical protein
MVDQFPDSPARDATHGPSGGSTGRPAATTASRDAGGRPGFRRPLAFGVLTGCIALVLYAAVALLPFESRRAAYDESTYHLDTVRTLAMQLASPEQPVDLRNIRTATTPGLHLALAAADAAAGPLTRTTFRLLMAVLGGSTVGVAGAVIASRAGGRAPTWFMLALVAPLAVYVYVVSSATHVLPDNAAWLFVFALVGLTLNGPWRMMRTAAAAWLLLGLVVTRQIHAWAAGVVLAAAWLDADPNHAGWRWLTGRAPRRARAAAAAGLAVLPALIVTLGFIWLWGGLVPPAFQGEYLDPATGRPAPGNRGLSPSFFVVTLASVAIVGVPFLTAMQPSLRERLRRVGLRALLVPPLAAVGLGAFVASIPETSTGYEFGRFSAWWGVTGQVVIADRSPLMVALAASGAGVATLIGPLLPKRTALLLLGALLGVTIAHTFNSRAFFRYVEPLTLLLAAVAAVEHLHRASNVGEQPSDGDSAGVREAHRLAPPVRPVLAAGPLLLAGLFAVITATQFR